MVFFLWLAPHTWLVLAVLGVEWVVIFVVVMSLGLADFWWIIGPGFLGIYLVLARMFTKFIRSVEAANRPEGNG